MLCSGWIRVFLAVLIVTACGGANPPAQNGSPPVASAPAQSSEAASAVAAPAVTWEALRTGTQRLLQTSEATGKVTGYFRKPETETFRIEVGTDGGAPLPLCGSVDGDWLVSVPGEWSTGGLGRLASAGNGAGGCNLWVRRRLDGKHAANGLVVADVLVKADMGSLRVRINAPWAGALPANPKLEGEFLAAWSRSVADGPLYPLVASPGRARSAAPADWAQLVSLGTGYDSVEAALHASEVLADSPGGGGSKVALSSITPPLVAQHPWAAMMAHLDARDVLGVAQREPLARLTPRGFYWVRANSFEAFMSLNDEFETLFSPLLRFLEPGSRNYGVAARYKAQLGLKHPDLARALGPRVIRDLAIVGSDPFLRQGSDVSVILRPTDPRALINALNAGALLDGEFSVSESEYEGLTIVERRGTGSAQLRQFSVHLADVPEVGPVTVISNSPVALRRIVDVALKGQGALASEADFQYMLARDAQQPSDVLAFAGDAFIEHAVAPATRVLDARRQLARSELTRVSNAALLFGELWGRRPRAVAELISAGLLDSKQLKHAAGGAIQFDVQAGPSSSYGSPAFLTPLIEQTAPKLVTAAEAASYRSFAERYAAEWRGVLDPIALRGAREAKDAVTNVHLRVLPLLLDGEHRDILEFSGDVQRPIPSFPAGISASLTIAPDSPLRRLLTGRSRDFLGSKFALDWVGESITLGLLDGPGLIESVRNMGLAPELPQARQSEPDFDELVRELPAFLALDVKHRVGAALALKLIQAAVSDGLGEGIDFRLHEKIGQVSVFRVAADDYQLFYALTENRLYFSLRADVMRALITPTGASVESGAPSAGQLGIRLAPQPNGALRTAMQWALESELRDRMPERGAAAALLRGLVDVPPDAAALVASGYWGYAPVTPEGKFYTVSERGIADPLRGTLFEPNFPELPLAESALSHWIDTLRGLDIVLGFDAEPGAGDARSLRSQVRFRSQTQLRR